MRSPAGESGTLSALCFSVCRRWLPCVALRLLCVLRLGRVITVVRSVASSGVRSFSCSRYNVIQFIDLELHLSSQAKLNSPPPTLSRRRAASSSPTVLLRVHPPQSSLSDEAHVVLSAVNAASCICEGRAGACTVPASCCCQSRDDSCLRCNNPAAPKQLRRMHFKHQF